MGKLHKIVRHKDDNFTVLDNTIFTDRRVGCKARGLYATIMGLPSSWDLTEKGLESILPDGRTIIRTALKELERCGYLWRERDRNKLGHIKGYTYHFHEKPVKSGLEPKGDFPKSEKPRSEKPTLENQLQSNKQESKYLSNQELKSSEDDGVLNLYSSLTGNKIKKADKELYSKMRVESVICRIGIVQAVLRSPKTIRSFKYCIPVIEEVSANPVKDPESYLKYLLQSVHPELTYAK